MKVQNAKVKVQNWKI